MTKRFNPITFFLALTLSMLFFADHAQAQREGKTWQKRMLEITYTDGSKYTADLPRTGIKKSYADAYTTCDVTVDTLKFGSEIQFSLSTKNPKPIKFVDLVLMYDKDFKRRDLIFYNNGTNTNSCASIRKPAKHGYVSRDIILFKNKRTGAHLNLGFGSFKRFFTYFKTDRDKVIARNHMEDRSLKKGEVYNLEPVIMDDTLAGDRFFDQYATLLGQRSNVKLKPVPMGWSSWSIYYGSANHDKVIKDSKILVDEYKKLGVDTIQLDGGWYKAWGDWDHKPNLFPKGIKGLSKDVRDLGLKFGNWYAHTLFRPESETFKNHHDYNIFYGDHIKPSFGGKDEELIMDPAASYALDLSNEDVQKYLYDLFKTATDDYGVSYYKLDFLVRSLLRSGQNNEGVISYPNGDYCVAVYNKAQQIVRDAVGPDTFMISCGAPIGESIGYFDAMRVDPDITNGHKYKDFWKVFRNNIKSIFLRSYYNGRAIIIDPDALVVRGKAGPRDNVALSYDQARVWATTVAMCGGSFIINEEMAALAPERKELIKQLLPVYGKGAVLLDFFEEGSTSVVHLKVKDARIPASLVSAFNLSKKVTDQKVSLAKMGYNKEVIAFDCWSKEVLGSFKNNFTAKNMATDSVKSILVREVPKTPAFLAADANFYLGVDRCKTETYSSSDKRLRVVLDKSVRSEDENLYLYVPKGYKAPQAFTKVWGNAKGGVYKVKANANGVHEFIF